MTLAAVSHIADCRAFVHALLHGQPYFGPALAATQGPAVRKAYMRAVVEFLVRARKSQAAQPPAPVRILEIGSWAGASTITWARAIQDFTGEGQVTCVDIWKPYFNLLVNSEDVYQTMEQAATTGDIYRLFLHNIRSSGVENFINCIIGDSRQVLPTLPGDSYDIVFIDGAHEYDVVLSDIANAKRLVRDGGVVCGDDLELTLAAVDQATHRRVLKSGVDYASDPRTGKKYHPAVTQVLADEFATLANYEGFWIVRRQGAAFEPVLLEANPKIPSHLQTIDVRPASPEPECSAERSDRHIDNVTDETISSQEVLPYLVGDYAGFNIVRVTEGYLAIRQSLGVVTIDRSARDLQNHLGFANVIFGSSLSELVAYVGLAVLMSEMAEHKVIIGHLAKIVEGVNTHISADAEALRRSINDGDAAVQNEVKALSGSINDLTASALNRLEDLNRLIDETSRSLGDLTARTDVLENDLFKGATALQRSLLLLSRRVKEMSPR